MTFDNLGTLLLALVAIVSAAIGMLIILIYQRTKGGIARKKNDEEYKKQEENRKKAELQAAENKKIRDFMEFDRVEDDMIVQNDGTRFIMAIRCMGINYDLMSEMEMLAVEEGFQNFLNTLKFPIQLYVQARSLNLSNGLRQYHSRLDALNNDYNSFLDAVNSAKATNPNLPLEQRQQMEFELRKRRNLIEYGADIVSYVERMSLNRSVLQRKYYIIVSYETSEVGLSTSLSKEEIINVAYQNLYTRCKTIQAAIAPCGVDSEILKSEDLAELLYIAYNKDDADMYDVKNAIDSGFYRLYSTAPSVAEKKRAALDASIKEEALAQAELALKNAMDSLKNTVSADIKQLTEAEQYEDDTKRGAMQLILDNQDQFEPEVVDKALESLNASMHQPLVSQEELDEVAQQENQSSQENMSAEDFATSLEGDVDLSSVEGVQALSKKQDMSDSTNM